VNTLTQSAGFWVLLGLGLVILYILPSLIGAIRRVESLGWLIVINLLPTGVGWLAALIGALMLPRRDTPRPLRMGPIQQAAPPAYPATGTRQAAAKALELIRQADERGRLREAEHATDADPLWSGGSSMDGPGRTPVHP